MATPPPLSEAELGKLVSAVHAAQAVQPGMRVGLGTGSTAAWLVRYLGWRNRQTPLGLTCVATSSVTEAQARVLGLSLSSLEATPSLDLVIDGADEFDPERVLIKGGGGALLQEKLVAEAGAEMLVITDPTKEKAQLGAYPLPVEVVRFGWEGTAARVAAATGITPVRRGASEGPFVTDEGHYLLDLAFGTIADARATHAALKALTGVVETGLFIDLAGRILIGAADGSATEIGSGAGSGRTTHPWPEDLSPQDLAHTLQQADPHG